MTENKPDTLYSKVGLVENATPYGSDDEEEASGIEGVEHATSRQTSRQDERLTRKRENNLVAPVATAEGITPSMSAVLVRSLARFFSTPAQTLGALRLWNSRHSVPATETKTVARKEKPASHPENPVT